MADGTLVIKTGLDDSGIRSDLNKLGSLATKGGAVAVKAIAAVSAALVAAGGFAVKTGMDFESQMSRVKAISGATGEDFEKLKEQAIELGASTAFSASEAAEGMENLASAGFTTAEIMEAMPGMLDLAASSGEDLASSSDIAASTLRGFGLAASDASHVADVLAKNAADTNAAVADTGEAMKYVAPVAKAMGIEFEETAAAIGIMADAGIKGSQAGTTIRGALSRLVKPTKKMTETMDELGLSFFDSEGKMLSLTDMTAMLQDKTSGLTDEQRNNAMVTLFGQEALSGMLALVDAGPEKISSLTESYKNSDGAAKDMAKTMQDNLKSTLEEVGGAAETMAIRFYDSVSGDLKGAAEEAIVYINSITSAFESGGLEGAITKAGDIFAELAVKAAQQAPKMVDSAVSLIEAFVSGIIKNRRKLYKAGEDVVKAVASGFIKLLPKELQKPFENYINNALRLLKNMGRIAGNIAKTAFTPLMKAIGFVAENIEVLASVSLSAVTAIKAFKVATAVTTAIKGMKGAFDALSASMLGNPIGLVAAALGALATAFVIANLRQEEMSLNSDELTESLERTSYVTDLYSSTLDGIEQSIQNASRATEEEMSSITDLAAELDTLVDENGNVKEGYEERVNFILGELNQALGTEMQMVDGVIEGYNEQKKAIEDLIAVKKAQTLLDNTQDAYNESLDLLVKNLVDTKAQLDGLTQSTENYKNAQEAASQATRIQNGDIMELFNQTDSGTKSFIDYIAALETGNKATDDFFDGLANGTITTEDLKNGTYDAEYALTHFGIAQDSLNQTVKNGAEKYAEESENLVQLESDIAEAQKTMANFEALQDALASGDTASITEAYGNMFQNIATLGNSSAEEVQKQMDGSLAAMQTYFSLVESGQLAANDTVKNQAAEMAAAALGSYAELGSESVRILAQSDADMIAQVVNSGLTGALSEQGMNGVSAFLSSMDGLDAETQAIFEQAVQGALAGTEAGDEIAAKADEMGVSYLDALKAILEVNSPSRAVKEIFSQVSPGAMEGLDEGKEGVLEKGRNLVTDFLAALSGGGLKEGGAEAGTGLTTSFSDSVLSGTPYANTAAASLLDSAKTGLTTGGTEGATQAASGIGTAYAAAILAQQGVVINAGRQLALSVNAGTKTANATADGANVGQTFVSGISSKSGAATKAGKALATAVQTALGSVNPKQKGITFGAWFITGIASKNGSAKAAGQALANAAKNGLAAISVTSNGVDFASQFTRGILAGNGMVHGAASSIANAAKSAVAAISAYDEGVNFVAGFARGINANKYAAQAQASAMATAAKNAAARALDEHSPSREMYKVGEHFVSGFTNAIADGTGGAEKAARDMSLSALSAADISAMVENMRNQIKQESIKLGAAVTTTLIQKVTGTAKIEQEEKASDRRKLADEIVDAFARAGITVQVDDWTFGKLVKEVEA